MVGWQKFKIFPWKSRGGGGRDGGTGEVLRPCHQHKFGTCTIVTPPKKVVYRENRWISYENYQFSNCYQIHNVKDDIMKLFPIVDHFNNIILCQWERQILGRDKRKSRVNSEKKLSLLLKRWSKVSEKWYDKAIFLFQIHILFDKIDKEIWNQLLRINTSTKFQLNFFKNKKIDEKLEF